MFQVDYKIQTGQGAGENGLMRFVGYCQDPVKLVNVFKLGIRSLKEIRNS